jgi:fructokinase
MRIGIDLGGTKIEGIAIGDDGSEPLRRRIASPRDDYRATLAAVAGLVHDLERELGARGTVGVGIPGTISPATGLVKNSNSTWLNRTRLADDLPRLLDRPLRFENDANCFALSEAVDGAGQGAAMVFGVILGTGCGGGVCVDRKVVVGANGVGGEWGHNPLPLPDERDLPLPTCWCGRTGCLETFLSGPGLSRDHERRTGKRLKAEEIVALQDESLSRYEERLARSLAGVINILDPDVIVLGGGMSNVRRLYTEVPRLWTRYVFSDHVATRLAPPVHGDSSGVRGAAWLWEK